MNDLVAIHAKDLVLVMVATGFIGAAFYDVWYGFMSVLAFLLRKLRKKYSAIKA